MKSTAQPDLDPQAPLPTGPQPVPKQRPALAQLRRGVDAFPYRRCLSGRRLRASNLLVAWWDGVPICHDAGRWLRTETPDGSIPSRASGTCRAVGQNGANRTDKHLRLAPSGRGAREFSNPTPMQPIAPPPCNPLHPKWSGKCSEALSGRSAAYSKNGVVRTPKSGKRTPLKVASPPSHSRVTPKDLRPGISIVQPTVDPVAVESALSETADRLGLRRGVQTQKPTLAATKKPLPDPTPEQVAAARATFEAFDATMDVEREILNLPKKGGGLPLNMAPRHRGGCPNCGHDRMMGGSCNECGHEDGTEFRPSADFNAGGDA